MALACEPALVVLDEPTTGLDVTTQKHILEVINDLRRQVRTAMLYVSHDLNVVGELADRVAVMYAGTIVECGKTSAVLGRPRHPYTVGLLRSLPRMEGRSRLVGIRGTALAPEEPRIGCPYYPRCDYTSEQCMRRLPAMERVSPTHMVRCLHFQRVEYSEPGQPATPLPGAGNEGRATLLRVIDLTAGYHRKPVVRAVNIEIYSRDCVALVGESGSGKSTIARCIAGLHAPNGGVIEFAGEPLASTARKRPIDVRRRLQIVFQNPDASLNPRQTVEVIIGRPLRQFFKLNSHQIGHRVEQLLDIVRLPQQLRYRYPRDLSGGEKQRVAIARALAAEPQLIICDEITSALDVSVQAAVLTLLEELRVEGETSFLFVSHDLSIVRSIADRVIVLNNGEVVEQGESERTFRHPEHAYTKALIAAAPSWEAHTPEHQVGG